MDVVAHNVARFGLPEDNTPPALVRQVQELYQENYLVPPRSDASSQSGLPLPPCICDGEVINFSPSPAETSAILARSGERGGAGDRQSEAKLETTNKERAGNPQEFKGSLFLIGGHADATFNELVHMAGDHPKVVVVGRASGLADADEALAADFFNAGVKLDDITIVVPKGYKATDKRFTHSYDVPPDANIVYFGGGQQDKLRREFDDHQLQAVKELLRNGALVGGSSAGAAVMSVEMINGGDEHQIEQAHGFGLTPWAIMDTHVGQRQRERRDVTALYDIGDGKMPVIGLDEDTRVRFFWHQGNLFGEIGGKGQAHIFQTPEMPPVEVNRNIMPSIATDGGKREANLWELHSGDIFQVRLR